MTEASVLTLTHIQPAQSMKSNPEIYQKGKIAIQTHNLHIYTVHVVTNPSADTGTLLLEKSCHPFFSLIVE